MRLQPKLEQRWLDTIDTAPLESAERELLRGYVSALIERGRTPIIDARHLSALLGIQHSVFVRMLIRTSEFYRTFEIKKRTGGFRTISVPSPVLRKAQIWILENILREINISERAHGFVPGRSIVSFAKPHLAQPAFLHADITSFFPSISFERIRHVFSNEGYSPRVSSYLAHLCSANNALPQGAPTSPFISNIVAQSLDRRLAGLADSHSLIYSRYADNIIMSGPIIPRYMLDTVSGIFQEEGFAMNRDKSYMSFGSGKRIVAGVSISGSQLRLPRRTKRVLRQEAFLLLANGYESHTAHLGLNDPIYVERLIGRLGFWRFIEPNNSFVERMLERLHSYSEYLDSNGAIAASERESKSS